jgi:hypothetical protein
MSGSKNTLMVCTYIFMLSVLHRPNKALAGPPIVILFLLSVYALLHRPLLNVQYRLYIHLFVTKVASWRLFPTTMNRPFQSEASLAM